MSVCQLKHLILFVCSPVRFFAYRPILTFGITEKNPILFLDFAYRFIYSGQKWVKVEEVSGIPPGK
jgi:hypothetical protein